MEVGLGWLGLGIGLAGSVAAAALSGKEQEAGDEPFRRQPAGSAVLTAVLTLVFWTAAMQRNDPFSPGQSLGWGFLIGGLFSAAAALFLPRFAFARLAGAGCASFGLLGASLAYLTFRGDPQPAMLGFAAGALMGGILAASLQDGGRQVVIFSAFSTLLALGVVFSVNHFNEEALRIWWPLPLVSGAIVCLGAFAGALLTSRQAVSAVISSAVVLALAAVFGAKVYASWSVLWAAGAGVLAAALAAWAAAAAAGTQDDESLSRAGAVSAVLAAAFVTAAFKLWAGLGIALGLTAAFSVLLTLTERETEDSDAARAVRGIALFGLSVVLFRLFVQLYKPELGGTDPRVHYTFIGAILGALLPGVLSAASLRDSGRPWLRAGSAGLAGFAAAVSPIVLLFVWEIKAVLGLTLGTAIASALCCADMVKRPEHGAAKANEIMLAIAAQMSAVVFVRPLLEIDLTRTHRAVLLGAVVAAAAVWLLVSGALSRRSQS